MRIDPPVASRRVWATPRSAAALLEMLDVCQILQTAGRPLILLEIVERLQELSEVWAQSLFGNVNYAAKRRSMRRIMAA